MAFGRKKFCIGGPPDLVDKINIDASGTAGKTSSE